MSPSLNIDLGQFREWLLLYFDRMQDMETETVVYRTAIEFLLTQVPLETRQTIEQILAHTRQVPEIKAEIAKRYERYRSEALARIEQGSLDQALQSLRELKAKGPIN